jgi:hypothetical protein
MIGLLDGGRMTESAFESWRDGVWAAALQAAGLGYQRPYEYADVAVMPMSDRKSSQIGLIAG